MGSDWNFFEKVLKDKNTRTVFISGPPGIGKTYTATKRRGKQSVYSITLTPETPAAELRGFFMPKGFHFEWYDGVFVRAMREGARVVVNEVSHASHDVLAILYPVLESPMTAGLTLPSGEKVKPKSGFQVVCTDNEPIEHLPDALQDRFDCRFEFDEPHPDALAAIPEKFRGAALEAIRTSGDRKTSIRQWMQVSRYAETLDLQEACVAVFGHDRGTRIHTSLALCD